MSRELVQQVSPEALAGWVIAAITALFGAGGIGSVIQGRRARAEGVSAKTQQAREEEARRQAESDARTDRELTRLAGSLTAALEQIEELREEQRQAFVREQQQRTVLMYHGAWDFTVLRELRRLGIDISEPPPLTPPFGPAEENPHA